MYDDMKGFSSAVSITLHVGLGAAVLVGGTIAGRSDRGPTRIVHVIYAPPATDHPSAVGGPVLPGTLVVPTPDFHSIPATATLGQTGTLLPSFSPAFPPFAAGSGVQADGWGALLTEEQAEVLTGPLPAYPELLRQAGVQGTVVLEAVVDTTGRVLAASIEVVSATNPAFVASARQALSATLFRPATVGGRPVRVRVRIPYDFAIRNGTGRAR
jgi:TonB family protein